MVEILILNGTIVKMDPERSILDDGAVAIDGGLIVDVGESSEMEEKYKGDYVIDATRKVVMPGLIDGHGHAGHSLIRSLGIHSETWYKACEVIYSEASTEEFWEVDALLTSLERLKFGTTCGITFLGGGDSIMRVDDTAYADLHCRAVDRVGVREFLAVGPRRSPFPRRYSSWSGETRRDYTVSFEDQIKNCKTIVNGWHGGAGGRVNIAMMFPVPHPERHPINNAQLRDLKHQSELARDLSREHELIFTMDGHSRGTVEFCHNELGLLGSDALFSHSTDLTPEEIQICRDTDTRIIHNPSAVASILGRCPVPELLDSGITVMLGSDAAAPDRSYDMFRHMFQCMRYHRRHFRDPRILPPGKVLEMVTIDGARALGLEKELGSLEPGKKADLILLDVYKPHLYPFNMPVDRIAYYANGSDVDTVLVDGRIVMEERCVKTVDEDEVLEQAQQELETAVNRSGLKRLFETTKKYWGHSRY